MQATDDSALLRQYVENHSDEAFALLVAQHINLVYSVALRQVGNPHQAEEITQAVFIILAKKAAELRHNKALSSWLFQAAHLTANNFVRSEIRRHCREQEAFMQSGLNESGTGIWASIAPSLDTAVAGLNEKDRRAIVLRFYEGRNLREVGVALGASEEAAKKRVTRALEKLQRFFLKRGVTSTTEILAGAISANSVQAAPAMLAKSVSAVAMTKGVAASGSTLTLIQGALKIMAWTKAKTAIVIGVSVLLAAGTTTITVKEIQEHKTYSWQIHPSESGQLDQVPPQVRIVPSKRSFNECSRNGKIMEVGATVNHILAAAYGIGPAHVVFPTGRVSEKYDFIANLPQGNEEALQREIKRKFGLVGKIEVREADVLLLKVKDSARLQSHADKSQANVWNGPGGISIGQAPLSVLAGVLELLFEKPVVDQTGMSGNFHFQFLANETNLNSMKARIESLQPTLLNELDQAGLELVPGSESIEMLVVERVK